MLQMLKTVPKVELPSWYKDEYNTPPPNWREVTQEDFVMSGFFTYAFSFVEYRQFKHNVTGWFSGILYFLGGPEGVAMHNEWRNGKYEVKFFRFAECIHTFEEVGRKGMEELAKKFP